MNKMRLTDGNQNFYVARYADLLLIRAEAKKSKFRDYTRCCSFGKQVRTRVNLPNITISSKERWY